MGQRPTIGVVGGGVLGKAIARGFMEHADVKIYDLKPELRTHEMADVATCDFVFFALPTPALPDGRCDTTHLEAALQDCEQAGWWTRASCYVIRSTVPIGFTQAQAEQREFKLPLLHSPEFLTARCALTDFQTPARNIIGCPEFAGACPLDSLNWWKSAVHMLDRLYQRRFPGTPVQHLLSNESELVKLACNSFFAAKVTLFNLFAEVAKANNLDWHDVLEGILSDGRIAHAHTAVPGPDGRPGYGGACLPKDLANLYHCAKAAGVDADLLREIHDTNHARRGGRESEINLP